MPIESRLAAAVILRSLEVLQPLLNSKCSCPQYFEAVDSLVWICSPESDFYFEILGFNPDLCREKLDLSFHAELALLNFEKNEGYLRRQYFAAIRYAIDPKSPVTYEELSSYVSDVLAFVESVLTKVKNHQSGSHLTGTHSKMIPAFLSVLSGVSEEEAHQPA